MLFSFQYFFDFPRADLLIVMGTSLEVEPFASIVDAAKPETPRLLINREAVGPWLSKKSKTLGFRFLMTDGIVWSSVTFMVVMSFCQFCLLLFFTHPLVPSRQSCSERI